MDIHSNLSLLLKNKIQFVFNKIQLNLIKEIKEKNADLKKAIKQNYKVYDKYSDSHILFFDTQLNDDIKNSFNEENDIFENEHVLKMQAIRDVDVNTILKYVSGNEIEIVRCYVFMLHMINYLYVEVSKLLDNNFDEEKYNEILLMFNKSMKAIELTDEEAFQAEMENIVDDDLKHILEKIHNTRKNMTNSPVEDNSLDETNQDNVNTAFDFLNNSKIGELAKEISEDIDVSKLNVKEPEDLLNIDQMFNGENSGLLGDIINKVGTKITDKIQNGDIKQEDLLSEAFSMMGKLNLGGGNNDFMQQMMANAMKEGGNMFREENASNKSHLKPKSKTQLRLQQKLNERNKLDDVDQID